MQDMYLTGQSPPIHPTPENELQPAPEHVECLAAGAGWSNPRFGVRPSRRNRRAANSQATADAVVIRGPGAAEKEEEEAREQALAAALRRARTAARLADEAFDIAADNKKAAKAVVDALETLRR